MPRGLPLSYIRKWGISKLAWRKFRAGALTKGIPTRTVAIKRRLKGETMSDNPRRRIFRRRRRATMTIPIAPILGLAAGLIQPAQTAISGDWLFALDQAIFNYTGIYGTKAGAPGWDISGMKNGLLPLAIGLLVHKFVGGAPLNGNKALARAKVPLLRI